MSSSQGTGPPSSIHGQKNTSHPLSQQTVPESAGVVASDSLAAESYNAGGEFASNRNAAPSGVKGSSSTLNTEDTSAATELDSARNRTEREDEANTRYVGASGGSRYPEGLGGQPQFEGTTSRDGGYVGGPSKGYQGSGSSGGEKATTGQGSGFPDSSGNAPGSGDSGRKATAGGEDSSSNVDAAPTYVVDGYLGDNSKPKGKNLTEDENLEGNRKTDFEIGSKDDPARANVQSFAGAAATGQTNIQREVDGQNTYDRLRDEGA